MNLIAEELSNYVEAHTMQEGDVLYRLSRATHLKTMLPQMLSGHLQGAFLQLQSQLLQPRRILEIGTFTGYSAICLCAGLTKDGLLHTIEIDEELMDFPKPYFEEAGLTDKIVCHFGDALTIIPTLEEVFDLVFIDADKVHYGEYFDLVLPKVRKGGLIIADNVLWNGKVLETDTEDKNTEALRAFNKKVHADKRVENVLLPIRDGLMMMRVV